MCATVNRPPPNSRRASAGYRDDYMRDDWRKNMRVKLDSEPPRDFMDLFQGIVGLERLPCEEFPKE